MKKCLSCGQKIPDIDKYSFCSEKCVLEFLKVRHPSLKNIIVIPDEIDIQRWEKLKHYTKEDLKGVEND
jgi:hypothetical protein